ncbi:hypothetical protein [Pleionea sediminis]|uniref:hypothetical protein n=1 Tax=Pleionea sediminis TaxID=2569479 RepID=UPI001FE62FF6|nr:hypothetical protein [Pleionea sediminis]
MSHIYLGLGTLKMKYLNSILLFLFVNFATNSVAEDRAEVADMSANLLLPDGSYLQVEVFTECALGGTNVGALLFSDEQVDDYAAGLTAKYGSQYGDLLRQTWATKRNPEDPRLPTYIVVFKSQSEANDNNTQKALSGVSRSQEAGSTTREAVPTFIGNCGGSVHPPAS